MEKPYGDSRSDGCGREEGGWALGCEQAQTEDKGGAWREGPWSTRAEHNREYGESER